MSTQAKYLAKLCVKYKCTSMRYWEWNQLQNYCFITLVRFIKSRILSLRIRN